MNWEEVNAKVNQKHYFQINNLPYDGEISKLRTRTFASATSKMLIRERGVRTRILYAGPHPTNSSTIAVYKICEMFGGKYFLEENIINPFSKSMQSKLVSLNHDVFHKFVDPEREMHQRRHFPNSAITVAHNYIRVMNRKKVFQNFYLEDDKNYSTSGKILNWFRYWKFRFYYLSK